MTDRQLERLRILACPDSYVSSLCDTDRAAVRAAIEELERLRAAVQTHHDQAGDDRCYLDDWKLYHDVLGEGTDPFVGALPPDDDMEESCRRYIRQRRCPGPGGIRPLPGDMTIAQLTAEVVRLQSENGLLNAELRDTGAQHYMSTAQSPDQIVTIDYTNHRGERATRRVVPKWIFFGQSPFHDGNQWFLEAYDVDKQAMRSFAMKDIHSWEMPKS